MQFIETKGTFLRSFPVFYIMVRYTDRKKIKECELFLSCKIYHGMMTISDSEDQYCTYRFITVGGNGTCMLRLKTSAVEVHGKIKANILSKFCD